MGTVIVDSKRKTISHLEGGILDRLLVQEGDVVKVGQPLLRLDDTKARSDLQSLESRRIGLIAKLARLRAEQSGEKKSASRKVSPMAVKTRKTPSAPRTSFSRSDLHRN